MNNSLHCQTGLKFYTCRYSLTVFLRLNCEYILHIQLVQNTQINTQKLDTLPVSIFYMLNDNFFYLLRLQRWNIRHVKYYIKHALLWLQLTVIFTKTGNFLKELIVKNIHHSVQRDTLKCVILFKVQNPMIFSWVSLKTKKTSKYQLLRRLITELFGHFC